MDTFPREHEVAIPPRTALDVRWTLPGSIFPREGRPAGRVGDQTPQKKRKRSPPVESGIYA